MEVSPSILGMKVKPAQLKKLEKVCKRLHFDVADGVFVNNKAGSPQQVKKIRTKMIKEVHLMTSHPEKQLLSYKRAGAKIVNIHVELPHTAETIKLAKKHGLKVGLAINPRTSLFKLEAHLVDVDEVLVMTVVPGKSGKPFVSSPLKKIRKLRRLYPKLFIKVDGGIDGKTIKRVAKAGADLVVSASYLFSQPDPVEAVRKLKAEARKV